MTLVNRTTAPPPALLEQLGALCSLLAHDLANQLCIISGSVSFAQMVVHDPARLTTALDAIARASENAGFAVSSFGEYRRTLPTAFPPGPASEVVDAIADYAHEVGWDCETPAQVDGSVLLPPPWVVFAASGIRREIRSHSVLVQMACLSEDPPKSATPEPANEAVHPARRSPGLQIQFRYSSKEPFSIKETRSRYENLGLLAAFELNRMLGGELDSRSLAANQQEVVLWLPLQT